MAQQDRYSSSRGRGEGRRRAGEQNWQQGREFDRDYNEQWGRHQPRQGGEFEDRYSGRGDNEPRGDEASQRGQRREQFYGRERYEDEDYLRVGGSYGGQYDESERDRSYSPSEGSGGRDQWGYGESRNQDFGQNRDPGEGRYAQGGRRGSRDWNDYSQESQRGYGQGYGSQGYGSGTSGRYGSDYSMTGTGLRGQWDRGFSDMSRGTSGGYGSSWSGGVDQPQRQSFRGRGPKGYERSDDRLKEMICERLMDDPNIDASEITVEVRNREVTLDGIVDDRRVKYEVEELIERCGGVKDVKNQLRVRARGSESGDDRSTQASTAESNYGTSGRSGITGSTAGTGSTTTGGSSGSSGRSR